MRVFSMTDHLPSHTITEIGRPFGVAELGRSVIIKCPLDID